MWERNINKIKCQRASTTYIRLTRIQSCTCFLSHCFLQESYLQQCYENNYCSKGCCLRDPALLLHVGLLCLIVSDALCLLLIVGVHNMLFVKCILYKSCHKIKTCKYLIEYVKRFFPKIAFVCILNLIFCSVLTVLS